MTEIVTLPGNATPFSCTPALRYASEVFGCCRLNVSNVDVRRFDAAELSFARFDPVSEEQAFRQSLKIRAEIPPKPIINSSIRESRPT